MNKISMDKIREINRGFQYIDDSLKMMEIERIHQSGLDITRRGLLYIVIVHDNEGKTMTEVLRATTVTKATLSNQIKVIVAKGYAKLYVDKDDSRKKRIKLTKKGLEAYALHESIREEIREGYEEILNEEEVNQIVKIGRKIVNAAKELNNEK